MAVERRRIGELIKRHVLVVGGDGQIDLAGIKSAAMRMLTLLLIVIGAGCASQDDASKPNKPATKADAHANLVKIWKAWQQFEAKNGFGPEDGRFDKYLREYGDPQEIRKAITITWGIDTRHWPKRDLPIAWQQVSTDGKYAVLFVSGQIDQLDEDEMAARGVSVGKHAEESKVSQRQGIERSIQENELSWKRNTEEYLKAEKEDDAYEKNRKTPDENPFLESARKSSLPLELKELARRREERKENYEVQRKAYEETKKRLQQELAKGQ